MRFCPCERELTALVLPVSARIHVRDTYVVPVCVCVFVVKSLLIGMFMCMCFNLCVRIHALMIYTLVSFLALYRQMCLHEVCSHANTHVRMQVCVCVCAREY
jgi:hypothetical protein